MRRAISSPPASRSQHPSSFITFTMADSSIIRSITPAISIFSVPFKRFSTVPMSVLPFFCIVRARWVPVELRSFGLNPLR